MMLEGGALFEKEIQQFYDESRERFLPDRYIQGTCPYCRYLQARGDQCENCGRLLDPQDLIDVRSVLSGTRPVLRSTRHFFFDLEKFRPLLSEWAARTEFSRPDAREMTWGLLREALPARAITRDIDWGVPVPVPGYENKRIYVWYEAVTGYFTASVEWASAHPIHGHKWEEWWRSPRARQYYFIGKDNIPFHTVIWPAIICARGDLEMPFDVPANQFLTFGNTKASKSQNVGLTIPDLLARYSSDTIRYYIAAVLPEFGDANFDVEELVRRNNDELVSTWGNLVQRALRLTHSQFSGTVPNFDLEAVVADTVRATFEEVADLIDRIRLRAGLQRAFRLAQFANRYLNMREPWRLLDTDRAAAGSALGNTLYMIAALRRLLFPYLPDSCERLNAMLGFQGALGLAGSWQADELPPGRELGQLYEALFQKLDAPMDGESRDKDGSSAKES
jgi:methionyl-tRNA synthetase